ncbi:MAG: hypothetical protein NQU41_06230 [Candidatus Methanosuratincola sp.]|jgi:hypothetical protein|uniref:Uncharacterized protein n=1 Tax=Methanosuratincola subterraneus TaxID=2593994 RepID=A0A444L9Q2_METS7|nr:hypothetical protein [Candidatus Methanosuratincola sp.]RWX74317.1 MAG: hypothetical protein Metus_0342 [Candidatus Methanosuratincola subterraneus]
MEREGVDKDKEKSIGIFNGSAKVGEVLAGFTQVAITPQDMSSPIALQMALSRIYEAMTKVVETGPKKKFIAEVRFTDSMGNPVVFALDLGDKMPHFTSNEVKARILVELYEEGQSQ